MLVMLNIKILVLKNKKIDNPNIIFPININKQQVINMEVQLG